MWKRKGSVVAWAVWILVWVLQCALSVTLHSFLRAMYSWWARRDAVYGVSLNDVSRAVKALVDHRSWFLLACTAGALLLDIAIVVGGGRRWRLSAGFALSVWVVCVICFFFVSVGDLIAGF